MKEYGLKYGFLTTYKETIFFKQEILTFDNELASINQICTCIPLRYPDVDEVLAKQTIT